MGKRAVVSALEDRNSPKQLACNIRYQRKFYSHQRCLGKKSKFAFNDGENHMQSDCLDRHSNESNRLIGEERIVL